MGHLGSDLYLYLPTHLALQGPAFNGVVWSLSTEVQFYLLVPFIYALLKRHALNRRSSHRSIVGLALIMFSLKLLFWLVFHSQFLTSTHYVFRYWYTPLATNLDVFLIGFLMNPLIQLNRQSVLREPYRSGFKLTLLKQLKPTISQVAAVVFVILLYLFTAYHLYHQELWAITSNRILQGFRTSTTSFILQPLATLVTAFFIFVFESRTPENPIQNLSFSTLLKNPYRVLEIFGHLTYGIYLWHSPATQKITPIFTASLEIESFYLRLTATLFLSLILATVTYYAVELPAARWKIYRTKHKGS